MTKISACSVVFEIEHNDRIYYGELGGFDPVTEKIFGNLYLEPDELMIRDENGGIILYGSELHNEIVEKFEKIVMHEHPDEE